MNYIFICNIKLCSDLPVWSEWELFRAERDIDPDLTINIKLNQEYIYGLEVVESLFGKPVLKSNNTLMCVNRDWTSCELISFDALMQDLYKLLNAYFLTGLSMYKSIEMHASLIDIQDIGIMFLGPSGIGKTTQAELWMKYRKAEIVNGDMVFVKQESDCFLGCGSPWHGSSPYCMNKQVPLKALIVLKQSSENRIRRLTGFEMVSSIMNSVFFPIWYQKGHEAVCKTLDALLQTVPVYELSCRPDEDAVRLTEETVFGNA